MKKILLVCILTLSCLCMACSNSENELLEDKNTTGTDDITSATSENTPVKEETTTEEQQTGYPDGEVQWKYVMYNDILYTHDYAVRRHIDESEVFSKFEGYEKIGTVNIDNLNMPDEELDASRFEEGATLYAKSGHDSEVYVYSVDTLYRMIPYKD
ncbi:MAG: hypothetical protein IJC76_04830 [Lachnospiraceae bacterium]|nr:hypothetical protein [Lachnospiraceae bacterium]